MWYNRKFFHVFILTQVWFNCDAVKNEGNTRTPSLKKSALGADITTVIECGICQKKFRGKSAKSSLKRHLKNNVCCYCAVCFSLLRNKQSLYFHMAIKHPETINFLQ